MVVLPDEVDDLPSDSFCNELMLRQLLPGKPSVATIRAWREQHEGPPFFRLRGRIWYRVADVRGWIESCRVDTALDQSAVKSRAGVERLAASANRGGAE